jgi:hypothetical protein
MGTTVDPQGVERADLGEVREQAVTSARELMSENVLKGRAPDGRRFIVTENAQSPNFRMALAPAWPGLQR